MKLTQDIVKELLYYNQETGEFIWKTRDIKWFSNKQSCSSWNNRFSGTLAGTLKPNSYIRIGIKGKYYAAHRLAWLYVYGTFPEELDHINGIKTDNRIKNLRECSRVENCQNRKVRSDNVCGLKSVHLHKGTKKYMARIQYNKERLYLGLFETAYEAHNAYIDAAKKLHGEFWNPGT
jgi:hypothetical protein